MFVPIVDDAHLLDFESLRKFRLLMEDFPKNTNLVLLAQPDILSKLALTINEDIKSRITYSAAIKPLAHDDIKNWIKRECDKVSLPHATFDDDAMHLVAKSSEGVLRHAKNLTTGTLLLAIRDQQRQVNLKHVNAVLMQPHWRTKSPIHPGH